MSKNPRDDGTRSVRPTVDTLASAAGKIARRGPAPVHLWNPPFCGQLDIRIARDGTWYYLGTPIGRQRLVKLFSSIIRKDNDRYYLVTPVEKVGICVEDVPFIAIDFDIKGCGRGQSVTFLTNVDEQAIASAMRPVRVERAAQTGEVSPYVTVRANLEARIDRKSFFRLVDICCHEDRDGKSWFGLWSENTFFPFIPSAEIG
ncbi:MAG: DUF1285 domain-containing protein [Rhodobacteraceae bacterium]|nr:DUF1285 domain-containing protein [Paracoccaceae bacterium]MCY4197691.1 DUF1285 domain-containing protein [Paracoccaceae bacterium]MCY4326277.1 DUF1285 domain-containing protein [Paracoccaceae bacterium]